MQTVWFFDRFCGRVVGVVSRIKVGNSLRAGSHFRSYNRCATSGEAARREPARGLAREMRNFSCWFASIAG